MENVSNIDKLESIKSLQSTIRKPQRTLLTRRIKALELSIQAIDKLSNK